MVVEDLFLLAGPRLETEYDPKLEAEREQKAKQERLETAELFSSSVDSKLTEDMNQSSFTTQLVTKIVDNLQVTVKNIHIRFEDNTSNKERMFSVGIMLKGLSAVSTDENWIETFLVNPQDAVNKLLKLELLSIYWNNSDEIPVQALTFEEFVVDARQKMHDDRHAFIIQPVSGIGKATLNKKFKEGIPKTLLNVVFDAFGVNMNYEQYYDILCALAAISAGQRALPYRKFRPAEERPKAEAMWRFAIQCYLSEIQAKNRRKTWTFLLNRRTDRKEYVNLYSNKLILGQLNEEDSKHLAELERRIEFDDIMHYRNLSKAFAKKSMATSPKGGVGSLFWGWLGYKSAASSDLVKDDDIKELYETIDYDSSQQTSGENMPADTEMIRANFELGEGSFSLSSRPDVEKPMISLIFTKLSTVFVKRPSTIAVEVSLMNLCIVENLLSDSQFKELLQIKPSQAKSPSSEKPFLAISYDQMTQNPDASAQINLAMRPLEMVINTFVADKITDFFLNKKTKMLIEALKAEARRTFDTIQIQTRANLQRALEQHKGTDLKVKISAPIILIPEDPTNLLKSIFVADLGKLQATSELVSLEQKSKIQEIRRMLTEEETEKFHELLYDKIHVQLRQFGIYFYENAGEYIRTGRVAIEEEECPKENKIIDEIDVNLVIENSIMPTAAELAQTKLSVALPNIVVFLSNFKFQKIMSLIHQLPKSSTPTEEPSLKADNTSGRTRKTHHFKSSKKSSTVESSPEEKFYDAFDDMKVSSSNTGDDNAIVAVHDEDVDTLKFIGKFLIKRIVVFFSKTDKVTKNEDLVMSLLAEKMSLSITAFETLSEINFCLGGIGINEHFSNEDGRLIIDAASETVDTDLLSIILRMVKPTNAEFTTTYEQIERSISIGLSSIKVALDPTNVIKIAEFSIKELLPALEDPNSASMSAVPSSTPVGADLLTTYQPKTVLDFAFSGLQVVLNEDQRLVGALEADRLALGLSLVGKKLSVAGEMSALRLLSYVDGLPVKLVYFEGGSVVNFGFETSCAASEHIFAGSNLATLNSGSLRIAYEAEAYANLLKIGLKFLKIVDFTKKEQGEKLSATPTDSGATTVETLAKTVEKSTTATYLRLKLDSPVVYIPSNDHTSTLAFYLGTLMISNSIEVVEEYGLDQLFDINLADIHISLLGDMNRTILGNFNIPLKVRLTSQASKRSFADVEIDGEVPAIRACLAEADYSAMMQVIMDASTSISTILDTLPKPEHYTSNADEQAEEDKMKKDDDGNGKYSREVEGKFLFDAKVRLKQLGLLLKDSNDKKMIEMNIEGIGLDAVSHTIRGLGIEVCVESLCIADVSNPNLNFNDLVVIGMAAAELNKPIIDSKKQILFRFEAKPDRSTIVKGYMESPRVFVLFDSIFYMKKFFLYNMPKSRKNQVEEAVPPSNERYYDDNDEGGIGTISPVGQKLFMAFNILDANLIIPANRSNKNTDALSLRVGSLAFKMKDELQLDIDDVSSFIYNIEQPEETKITVIDYFAAHIRMATLPTEQRSVLDVNVYPLTITLSYQDLQLILTFVSQMSEAQTRYAYSTSLPEPLSPPSSTVAEGEDIMATPLKTIISETGNIALDYVRVIIIDDSASAIVPLLELNVDKISISISDWSLQLTMKLQACLALNCYNPSISYWEPIIEPWTFAISMGKSELEPNSENTILLTSESGLEVIVVHHALERILSMLKKLGLEKRSGATAREISPPYVFGNFLENTVKIWAASDESNQITLSSQEIGSFSFENWREQRSETVSRREHRISMKFNGPFKAIEGFSIDRDGYFPLKLDDDDDDDDNDSGEEKLREFCIQTFLIEGIRHVKLREKIMIHNETKCTLVITMEGGEAGKSIQIEPEKQACVPPWLEDSYCAVTPIVEGLQLSPIPDAFIPSEVSKVDGSVYTSKGLTNEEVSFNILASCQKHSLHSIMDITFVAPLVVENLLPVNIKVQFSQLGSRKVFDIAESETLPIYYVDPTKPCLIAVSIPELGLFSTNECDIVQSLEVCDLIMQNEDGLELKVFLSRGALPTAALNLSIAAYYLLVNQTNMTVQVLSEANNKIKRNGQVFNLSPKDNERPLLIFSHPNPKNMKNRARIRIADSNWSDPISFEAVGAEFEFDCKSMLTSKWYNLGGYVTLGQGKVISNAYYYYYQ